MTRATTKGGSAFGPKAAFAFLAGVGIGLGLVAPVLQETLVRSIRDLAQGSGAVVLVGVAALGAVMLVLAVLYQSYLRA